ncbi:MAG TPA: hypothetical protein VFB96_11065 [Pirellulaceae bacterium]|nr:hypothetical protein [Pirellulaceae bacterium]
MFGWLKSLYQWTPVEARRRILEGNAPSGMRVQGYLSLNDTPTLDSLPPNLTASTINVTNCRRLRRLPAGLSCQRLLIGGTAVEWLPPDLEVSQRIDASDCRSLRKLPALRVHDLDLRGCTALEELPDNLQVCRLDISNCPRVNEIPARAARSIEHLTARGCTSLVVLPPQLTNLEHLDVSGCTNLEILPDGMKARSWIDLAGTSVRQIPWSLRSVRILWHGVPVSDRIVFDPESITLREILTEPNLELRRVLIDRVGMEWFVANSRAEVIDRDRDRGGERELLRIRFDGGEDLLCVAVHCPSTGRRYILRVPPDMRTCRHAVAWTAGIQNPAEYQPAVET